MHRMDLGSGMYVLSFCTGSAIESVSLGMDLATIIATYVPASVHVCALTTHDHN
jgi:hypothetical protein